MTMNMRKKKVLIMGAAGRDFHNFNVYFRHNPEFLVAAFTATQIPFIEKRAYPPSLSGALYSQGIPIYPEEMLSELIKKEAIDMVVFSYSDVSHEYIMHRASLCTALGANFVLLGSEKTMLRSKRPVISVTAIRTGCGKSGVTRFIAKALKEAGKKAVAIRHPMPYGDLAKEIVQRFSTVQDIEDAKCTIEEREEYEPLVETGTTVYAGVDYKLILEEAEKEADMIIWDGGNNDLPFIKPWLELVVADPLRPGHELMYYPGEANLRRAETVIINKVNSARAEDVAIVRENIRKVNPGARIVETGSIVTVEGDIRGKKVIVIEDGPTVTHGGMTTGAGAYAARINNATTVDVRPFATGSIKETLAKYPELTNILPAMGYSKEQLNDLEDTLNRTPCDIVLAATPSNISSFLRINKPVVRVRYEIEDTNGGLLAVLKEFLKGLD